MMVFRCAAFAVLVAVALRTAAEAQDPVKHPAEICLRENLKNSVTVNGYVFEAFDDGGEWCLQVVQNGRILFRRTNDNGGMVTLGQPESKEDSVPAIPNGTDITGRGKPDMIVAVYSGGAHCCWYYYVFELGTQFRALAKLDGDDTPGNFADLDHNGHYYYVARDWSFAYWPISFAGSPSAQVVLRWANDAKGGGFHLALDKMQKPQPTQTGWENILTDARGNFDDWPGEEGTLWNSVLNLIYTGHSDLAWKLLDETWPATLAGRGEETRDFCSILRASPYWPDLEPSVTDTPPACASAKPRKIR